MVDSTRVTHSEATAGIAGLALVFIMIVVKWYGVKGLDALPLLPGQVDTSVVDSQNAFQAFTFADLFLLLTALAAVALPLLSAAQVRVNSPVALGAVVAMLGAVAVIVILIRIITPPNLVVDGVHISEFPGAEVTRKVGVWLGLIAATAVAYGGFAAVRDKHASRSAV